MSGKDQLLSLEEVQGTPPGYISEAEVKDIIHNYNSNLAQFTYVIDDLTRKNHYLEQSLYNEAYKYNKLEQDYDHTLLNLQSTTTELQDARYKIHTLQTSLSAVNSKENQLILSKMFEELTVSPSSDLSTLQSQLINLKSSIFKLIQDNSSLRVENESLKVISDIKLKKDLLQLRCKHCRKLFLQSQNYAEACEHHSGKLKYYSCKGCGKDAYYNCCNRCTDCSRGCKLGRHIPTDNYL